MNQITKTIKKRMIDKGLRTADLAERLNRTRTAISLVLNCRYKWRPAREGIARELGIPYAELWTDEE